MVRSSLSLVLIAVVGACTSPAWHTSRTTPAAATDSGPTVDAVRTDATAGSTAPVASDPSPAPSPVMTPMRRSSLPPISLPQGDDYAVSTMFHQRHGDYIRHMRPYRDNIEGTLQLQPDVKIKDEDGRFTILGAGVDAYGEAPVDPDTSIILGAVYEARHFDFSSTFLADDDETLHRTSVKVGLHRFVSDDWLITGVFEPGLYTDFDGTMNSKDWQFFGDLISTHQVQPDLWLKWGLQVSNVFEDVPVYPVLGVAWTPLDSLRVDVFLPRLVEVSYYPTASAIVGAGLSLDGNEYSVRSPVGAPTNGAQNQWDIQELKLYLLGRWRTNDNFSIYAKTGAVLAGDVHFRGANGLNSDGVLQPAYFLEIGAGISF